MNFKLFLFSVIAIAATATAAPFGMQSLFSRSNGILPVSQHQNMASNMFQTTRQALCPAVVDITCCSTQWGAVFTQNQCVCGTLAGGINPNTQDCRDDLVPRPCTADFFPVCCQGLSGGQSFMAGNACQCSSSNGYVLSVGIC